MQSIEYILREFDQNYQNVNKHHLVIKMNNEFWTVSFLKKHPNLEGYFTASTAISNWGETKSKEIEVISEDEDWAAIRELRSKFFTDQNFNKYAKFIINSRDDQALFEMLTELSENLSEKNNLPNYLYDLKKLGDDNVTLSFLHINENDFEWVSIITEKLK